MKIFNNDKSRNFQATLRTAFGGFIFIILLAGFVFIVFSFSGNLLSSVGNIISKIHTAKNLSNQQPQNTQVPNGYVGQAQKSSQPQQKNLPSVIAKWSPAVALIVCSFSSGDIDFGSGFLIKNSAGQIEVITNKHVLTYDTPDMSATSCAVRIPGDKDNVYTVYNTGTVDNNPISWGANNLDWGYVVVANGDTYFNNVANKNLPLCQQQERTGDNVIVLGYPDYAGQFTDPTATQGIISGYASPYYTTSAQIESGNSGGVAIDPDKDCYIGIPSAVQMGNYANLGRILNANVIFSLPY